MKIKKIVAAIAAAAMAVSMVAVNAFASTVTLDSEYKGGWAQTSSIPKSEFAAIGGDVKVVLTIETVEPLAGEHNHLLKPINAEASWDGITKSLKSDTGISKDDTFIVIADGQTSLEFVVPEAVWSSWTGWADEDGNPDDSTATLSFQANDVIVKSAELTPADTAQGDFMYIPEADATSVMNGTLTRDAAPAASTPAADSNTASATTGNVPAAVMVSVMAVAGAAAVASKKRK
ncbi:MAG: hypothetical protein NC253_08040 [Ruminococcus sp.]|nr:hypothetical protein [Ruminococcus sp.]MCM1380643.1 hypothetical protein [Muribaculaceae bacterium]MCM1478181.1 hypothetical protein [Muribaculaceae bacterium]